MLEHQDPVGGCDRDSSARAAFPDDDRDIRHAEFEASISRACNGLRLAAFLRADPGICPRRVDQRQDRNAEAIGHLHQPLGLTVSFWPGHPEIVLQAAFGR